MKKLMVTICCCCALYQGYAQDSIRLKFLAQSEQYNDMINFTTQPDTLSSPALYYLALAYHIMSKDSMAQKTLDMACAKSPKDYRNYYLKGSLLNYEEKFEEAIPMFQKSLACDINAASYEGMGIAYYYLKKYPQAMEVFTKATELPDADSRSGFMIGQIYIAQNENEKALAHYYKLKETMNKDDEHYKTVLYDIIDLENKEGRTDQALPIIEEMLATDSADYEAFTRLIQVQYHNKDYVKGEQLKAKMYAAQRDGKFINNRYLNDRFCFDKFKWTDKEVMVYERYEHGKSSRIYNKIIFVVVDKAGFAERTIQTEYSPISEELGGQTYILCGNKGDTHFNYALGFDDNSKYEDLKTAVLDILNNKKTAH
ncbi:hypothetical protein [Chitinophaga sp.]|uniref:tetratricopeptide repeat protein n=1 Tax=Chitinophaga sp. TaxID=1869181 RepID=UPI0031D845B5